MDINTALQMDKDRGARALEIQKLFFFLDPNNAPVPKGDVAAAGAELQKFQDQHPDLKGRNLEDVTNALRHEAATQNSQLPSSKDKIAPWLEIAKEFHKDGNSTEKFGSAGFERDLYEHNFESGNTLAKKIQNDLFLLGVTKTVPDGDIKQAAKDFEKYLKTQPGFSDMTATAALNALGAKAADSRNWQVPAGLDKDGSAAWQKLSDTTPHQPQQQPAAAKPPAGTPTKTEAAPKPAAPETPKPETHTAASHEGETEHKAARPSLNADFNKHSHVATDGDTAFQAQFKAQFEKDPAAAYQAIHDQKALLNTDAGIRHMQDMLIAVGENIGHKKVDGWNGEQTTKAIERVDAKLDGLKADAAAKAAAAQKPAETKPAETKPATPATTQTTSTQQTPAPVERQAPPAPRAPEFPAYADFSSASAARNTFYRMEQEPGRIGALINAHGDPNDIMALDAHKKNGEAYLADPSGRFVARYDTIRGPDGQIGFAVKDLYELRDANGNVNAKEVARLAHDEKHDETKSDNYDIKQDRAMGRDGVEGPRGAVIAPQVVVEGGRGFRHGVIVNEGPVPVEVVARARPFAAPVVIGERGWCSPHFAEAGGYARPPRVEAGFREAPHRGVSVGFALRF